MKLHRFSGMLVAGLLAGCQTLGGSAPKPAAPAPVSPQIAMPKAGITGGGLIGGPFGIAVASADKQLALDAEYKALEYAKGGEVIAWTGAGASGKVQASQPYRVGSQDCRQYSHELTLAGNVATAKATACRNSDGSWSILE